MAHPVKIEIYSGACLKVARSAKTQRVFYENPVLFSDCVRAIRARFATFEATPRCQNAAATRRVYMLMTPKSASAARLKCL